MCARRVNQWVNGTDASTGSGAAQASSDLIGRFFRGRLKLAQLRLLVAIADLGQLRKVADALSVTPPAVSKQVAEIEDALQRPILRRVANRVEFTELGQLLVRRSREVLDSLERARVEVDALCAGVAGRVAFGAVPSLAPVFLPPLVMALKQRAPNMAVVLQEGLFERLAPMLEDATLDVVVARETRHRLAAGFRQKEVLADPVAVVCGSQHTLADRPNLKWPDMDGVPWILPIRGSTTFDHLERLVDRHRLRIPAGSLESGSWPVNVGLLQRYPYVTLMPLAYARMAQTSARIAVLPLSTEGMLDRVKIVWRKENENPALRMVIETIEQEALRLG